MTRACVRVCVRELAAPASTDSTKAGETTLKEDIVAMVALAVVAVVVALVVVVAHRGM